MLRNPSAPMTPSPWARSTTRSIPSTARDVGHFDEPQCVAICPVSYVLKDPATPRLPRTLWLKYQALRQAAGKPCAPMPDDLSTDLPASLPQQP